MKKTQFIEKLASRLSCSSEQAEMYFDAVIDELKDLLMKGDEFTISGFGKFLVRHRPKRAARNPQNGVPIEISAKTIPVFKPGDALKLHISNALKTED